MAVACGEADDRLMGGDYQHDQNLCIIPVKQPATRNGVPSMLHKKERWSCRFNCINGIIGLINVSTITRTSALVSPLSILRYVHRPTILAKLLQ